MKPQIISTPFLSESYLIKDEKGIAQIRIEACGNIKGLDDIMTFIRNAEAETKYCKPIVKE